MKTLNQKMEYLRNGVRYCLLLILLVLAFATGAHAAQDNYYYPNYDASANGCVDLMNYVKRVTVTVNGVDYTLTMSRVISARECAPHMLMVSASSPASLSTYTCTPSAPAP